jgi:tetrahydromethanopterin S-methyltransferase subunit C
MDEQETQLEDRPIGELMRQLSDQTTTLVRQEIELAKAEMTAKGKQLGMGAGAFGGAGLMGLYAVGAITACLILALSTAVAGWLAALIVGVVYAAIAGVLALIGKKKTQAGGPPVPERAISSTKEDVEWAKTRAKTARQ